MRVLIVWANLEPKRNLRNTVIDYLSAFPRYDKKNEYYYLNLAKITPSWDYKWIKEGTFDLILFTCTFLGIRWDKDEWKSMWDMCERVFGPLSCRKVILPQDDYDNTAKLWDFIKRVKIDEIFTVLPKADHDIVYPREKIGNVNLQVVLTGYVEEKYLDWIYPPKTVDVIYRASKLPYKFGKMGQQKTELIDVFVPKLTGLKIDIKNTIKKSDIYSGNSWIEHLASARCVLGCISGSSVVDLNGEIGRGYEAYLNKYPTASYSEAKEACFPHLAENLEGALGPRNLEAAITRTCQVLIRADYSGVLKENIDYIPVNKDYSNIDEVVEKIRDVEYCKRIADNCYRHVVESGMYTYQKFVERIIGKTGDVVYSSKSRILGFYIKWKCCQHNEKVETYIRLRDIYAKILQLKR